MSAGTEPAARVRLRRHREPALPLVVRGEVVHGDERGRLLGFPTANLVAGPDVREGVWAGTVDVLSPEPMPRWAAAISVGRRPTYYGRDGVCVVEAHLLDFSGDLYGAELVVRLETFLRPQRRFRDQSSLEEQMRADVLEARAWAARPSQLAR